MINYSLVVLNNKVGDESKGNKTYAVAQYDRIMDIDAMAEHMAGHSSVYDKGDFMAMSEKLVSCIREQLLLGNRVKLGSLGTFGVRLVSTGAKSAEEFVTSQIKDVKAVWYPSRSFASMANEAEFQFVGSRDSQRKARLADKAKITEAAVAAPEADGNDDGADGNNGGVAGE